MKMVDLWGRNAHGRRGRLRCLARLARFDISREFSDWSSTERVAWRFDSGAVLASRQSQVRGTRVRGLLRALREARQTCARREHVMRVHVSIDVTPNMHQCNSVVVALMQRKRVSEQHVREVLQDVTSAESRLIPVRRRRR